MCGRVFAELAGVAFATKVRPAKIEQKIAFYYDTAK